MKHEHDIWERGPSHITHHTLTNTDTQTHNAKPSHQPNLRYTRIPRNNHAP